MAALSDAPEALVALERQVHEMLRGQRSVGATAEALGVDPVRLDIYRGFVRGHVDTALHKSFPILEGLLGEPAFQALCDAFFEAHPPSHWELNAAAEPFPAFLAARVDEGHAELGPFHVALAQHEWADFATFVHPARVPTEVEAPTLNPTLTVLQLVCPVTPFVVAWQDGRRDLPLPTPEEGPELCLFFRHPVTERVQFHVAIDDYLFAIKVAHEGLEAAAVAEAAGLPVDAARAAMARARDIGLVLLPG